MGRKTTLAVALIALLQMHAGAVRGDEHDRREVVSRVKAATALVLDERRFVGTAFCVDAEGWFVANRNPLGRKEVGSTVMLVLASSESDQRVVQAEISRLDREHDLALLKAEGDGFAFLPIGEVDELYETMKVTAFCYPMGHLSQDNSNYPSVLAMIGHVTGLPKVEGQLEKILLDHAFTEARSGGPLLDPEGHVIGVMKSVVRSGQTIEATSAEDLLRFLHTPVIKFAPAEFAEDDLRQETKLTIEVDSLKEPPEGREVELEIQIDDRDPQRFAASGTGDGRYEVNAVLDSLPPAPELLRVEAEFDDGRIVGRVAKTTVKVGDRSVALSKILRIEFATEGEPAKVVLDGEVLHGTLVGLDRTQIDLGGTNARLNLANARKILISPIEPRLPMVKYRWFVRDGGEVVASASGTFVIRGRDVKPLPVSSATDPPVVGPVQLADDIHVVKLPGPVDQVVVGAGGRLLIVHCKNLQQLALFDVGQAKIVKLIPLLSNDISYAAGIDKLFIGYRDQAIIQRWDLTTYENELFVDAPPGGVGKLAIGAQAVTPLISLVPGNSHLIDTATMKAERFEWQGWKGSTGGPHAINVSFDGSTAVVSGGGWAGTEVASILDGKIVAQMTGGRVQGEPLVAGNGALILPTEGSIVSRDFSSTVLSILGSPFPAVDAEFSLAHSTRGGTPGLTLFSNNDPKPLATLPEFPELKLNSSLPISQRVFLIPQARVLITVGMPNDRLILRPFDLEQTLAESDEDYLVVESTPLTHARLGALYEYRVRVLSRRGGVKYALQTGPDGMIIGNNGVLSWNVPKQLSDDKPLVIVEITDDSKQTTFQSFRLVVK